MISILVTSYKLLINFSRCLDELGKKMKIIFKVCITRYINIYSMNNPFFTYPGYPYRGYKDHDEYLREILRLNEYLKELHELNELNKCLLHFTIGAAMEEAYEIEDYKDIYKQHYQWRQLLPAHIDYYACANPESPIRIIILSPNKTFHTKEFKEPQFIKYSNDIYQWETVDQKTFKSKEFNLIVKIFCTMMPHQESDRNQKLCKHVELVDKDQNVCYAKQIIQTEADNEFIKNFYINLEQLIVNIEKNGGQITCFSFAVFHRTIELQIYNDYVMFSEIKKLFLNNKESRLLCRWVFDMTKQDMIVFNKNNKKINYLEPKILKP